ncbi:amino acid adenylation domain-containing protein [Flavobacterium sp.]|uniref:non-ribosomal peptide synthetase n=1 Tax=Flavobacterium sp. TaxID=239 RepID=UPI003D0A4049
MNTNEVLNNFHLASKYWKKKILNRSKNIQFSGQKESVLNARINGSDLLYFNQLTGNNDVANYTVIIAVYSFLLKRLISDFDGYIVSNFKYQDKSLLLSFPLDINKSFKEYLQNCKDEILESLKHFENDNNKAFQTNDSIDLSVFSNFRINVNSEKDFDCKGLLFDIKISENNDIDIQVAYLDGFVKKEIIAYLVQHFTYFLVNLKKYIGFDLSAYSLLTEEQKSELIVDFNDTNIAYPLDKTIVDLFEEQVTKTPDNIAVIFNETKLTYSELNEKANQLAHYIEANYTINSGSIIGVFLAKSDFGIISLLAILKLGAAYMPIDTHYPQERIDYLIKDSGLKILICDDEVVIDNCVTIALQSINLDKNSKENINKNILSKDLAYIIYTSGSTGNPKGVLIEHRGNVNMSLDQIRSFEILENDKVVWFASVAFDASISEIMMSLYSGATLCIPTEETIKDKIEFVKFLKKTKASVVTFPPSYLGLLSENDISGLRCIITAGESANSTKAIEVIKSGIDYYNAYGPTECAVCVSIYKATSKDFEKVSLPIGRPIANTKIYILDDALQLVPIGVTGKLYVSGTGLARGYLGKLELTDEKFIVNPFIEGERMYDTGDLGCWLPEGNVEFLGRKDQQVKLRGYRIELGEIENVILQYSTDLKQVAVEVKENNQEKVLVAYFVSAGYINKSAFRSFLQEKLPKYMIPSFYILLEKLPLTPNGKVDRKALPDITGNDSIRTEYVAPVNETEESLVLIWQEVLGIAKIGVTDNFFELGGHSLIVSQIINRTQKQLGKTVSFKVFFANPTIKGLSVSLHENQYTAIPKVSASESYPLTASQSRLWILSQLEGGSLAYNMPAAVKLTGAVNADKFKESFQLLIERHEILRTYFKINPEGEVRQYVVSGEQVDFGIEEKDFSLVDNQGEKIADYLQERNVKPFDLEQTPLIRASLIKLNEDEYVFFLSLHHIIGDGWSIEILIAEVVKTYNALLTGKRINLPELRIQYKDYAVWLNNELKEEKNQSAEQYWLQKFEGEFPVLNLPSFKKRPLVQTYNGDSLTHSFSKAFLHKLKTFSKEQDVTLFMTLLAGINLLLHKYTGQDDIIIGTPVAGREHPDLENQMGLYLNTLSIRTQLQKESSFIDFVALQKETLLGAYDHQSYPFDVLVEKLNLKRNTSRSALFDVLVVLQNQEQLKNLNTEEFSNIEISDYDFKNKTSQLDISFTFVETDGLNLTIEYNTDIYDDYIVERIFPHFENLLSELLEQPQKLIQDAEYLMPAEKQQLLVEFNTTEAAYSKEKTITNLFEEQVEKTPNNIAIIFNEIELTYRELNEKSNKFAHYLRENTGIQPDDLVGIKLDRSEKMIIVILGILKSGAAYVPIDINYPQERIAYIERDSNCKVVVDQAALERYNEIENRYSKRNIENNNKAHHLAYVIYTSGTTGNPKGVMIQHNSLLDYVITFLNYFQVNESDSILSQSTISFDTSIEEIFPILNIGGKLIIVEDNKDFNSVLSLCEKHEITLLSTNPFMIDFLNSNSNNNLFSLKKIISGGDVLKPDYINKIWDKVSIYNSYGPTETTVCATYYEINKFSDSIPIGSPISNTQIYILNEEKQLVSIGVSGKIFISGKGVAKGYLNKPELTSEKFIANPFQTGERMYDTGDLGYWLPNGNIEFLGRKDNQVKIRGYRIELGEIENTIFQYSDALKQVVVELKNEQEKVLVAYLVSTIIIDKAELKSFLQERLPEYMIPGFYIILDALPLTLNGKIDRKALPEITEGDIVRVEYIAPKNNQEKKLAAIWQEVLGVEKIGLKDNFFELGGHSLKVTKLLNSINKVFDVKMTFNNLFFNMILEDQIKIIETAKKGTYSSISKIAEQSNYALSSSQRRLWLLSQFDGGNKAYNMPSVFELKGNLSISCLQKAFQLLIDRHESLRTVFREENEQVRQVVLKIEDAKFELYYEDLSSEENSKEKVKSIIQKETGYSFDLSSDSLLRAKVLKTGQDTYLFIAMMHHIISDGWSADVMTNDLFTLYTASRQEIGNTLPALKIQYKDFAAWQQEQLKKDTAESHKSYWLQKFEGPIPVLDLPTFETRPVIKTYNGKSVKKLYNSVLLKDFNTLCKSQGSTLFMGLVATIKLLLYKYTDQKDIIIGTAIAGRDHIDLQNQIGFYVNTLALRTQFESSDSFRMLLENVKNVTLGAYEHQIYPFDELVNHLPLKRDMSRNPLFDVMITFVNTDNLKVNIQKTAEVSIKAYETEEDAISKFDIEFIFEETAEGLNLNLVYNTDLYERQFAATILNHLEILLQSIISKSEVAISSLKYLTEDETNQLLITFNDTKFDYLKDKTLLDVFEKQVNKTPEKEAVKDDFKSYTYFELNKLSNQIAQYISAAYGDDDKSPIGVLLNRSATMIPVLLGILKSGRCYIPLDPTFPKERLNYIINNSETKALISEKDFELEKVDGISVIILESILDKIDEFSGTFCKSISSNDTAYIIYTSGSTGNPKGVEIGHHSLLNFLTSIQQNPGVTSQDTLFSVTTYSFDISILEFFVPLFSGASLYIASHEVLSEPHLIIQKIEEIKPTLIQATPSFYQMLFNADWQGNQELKVLCGGDLLSEALAKKLIANSLEVWNMYGPTETTIWSSVKKIKHPKDASNIGMPINNTQLYILDSFLNPKPKGTIGALYIAGDGLAKGYYRNEKLTKEKFIKNPFKNDTLLYETGDLGKWNEKGEIEFLGRNDNQVKIRGYRIELGDIENALLKNSLIDSAIALVKTDENGNKLLVSYIISSQELNISNIKSNLKDLLPDYMIPAYFMQLENLPLTPNGKIDRKALPNPENSLLISDIEYVAPRNEVEEKLAKIWIEVLRIERVGIKDNFFELGGNSLTATKLISLIHKEFEVKISINDLFKNTILEEQAVLIENIYIAYSIDNKKDSGVEVEKFTI